MVSALHERLLPGCAACAGGAAAPADGLKPRRCRLKHIEPPIRGPPCRRRAKVRRNTPFPCALFPWGWGHVPQQRAPRPSRPTVGDAAPSQARWCAPAWPLSTARTRVAGGPPAAEQDQMDNPLASAAPRVSRTPAERAWRVICVCVSPLASKGSPAHTCARAVPVAAAERVTNCSATSISWTGRQKWRREYRAVPCRLAHRPSSIPNGPRQPSGLTALLFGTQA